MGDVKQSPHPARSRQARLLPRLSRPELLGAVSARIAAYGRLPNGSLSVRGMSSSVMVLRWCR
jgi:hypothetical protein